MKLVRGSFLFASFIAAFAMMFGGTVSAETLVAHYEFNEAVGTTDNLADSTGNGHTLTQTEDPGTGTVVFDAELNSNVLYNPNGSGYLMDVGTVSLDMPVESSITLAGWFNQTGIDKAGNLYTYAIHLGTNGSEPICTLGFLDTGEDRGKIVSYIESDWGDAIGNSNYDQLTVKSADAVLTLDENGAFDGWHHVAVVYDRSIDKVAMYLDGVAISTTVLDQENPVATHTDGDISHLGDDYGFSFDTGTGTGQQGGVAGYQGVDTSEWLGYLDDVRFYQGALSAEQVASLVPEPGSILLIVSGALGLLFLRRRK